MKVAKGSQRTHATVIGGSIAGLLAARVLSDFYEKVTIFERDELPQNGEQRRGVPHGWHAHALLSGGLRVTEKLFPGITQQLVNDGAPLADAARDGSWYVEGGHLAKSASGLVSVLTSRPFLETHVRQRLESIDNVRIEAGITVRGITANNGRIRGLLTDEGEVTTDLIVDASGRGSQCPKWLESLGYDGPAEERIGVQLSYTTRVFRMKFPSRESFVAVPVDLTSKRGGVILEQENNRWIVTLIGYFGESAPVEIAGFRSFARSLPSPKIYESLIDAEPIGTPRTFKFPASTRRYYERLTRLPEGLIAFGDAICSFNPVYGQGMSCAALQADALRKCLERSGSDLERRFFKSAANVIDSPWSIAVGGDLRLPETAGKRSASVRFINWYVSRLHKAGHTDPIAAAAFLRVAHLVDSPASIFSPAIVARILRNILFSTKKAATQGTLAARYS